MTNNNYDKIEFFIKESWKNFSETINCLKNHDNDIVLIDNVGKVYRTTLTIEAGAYCEMRLVYELKNLYCHCTNSDSLTEFVYKALLERKFHSLFQWNTWTDIKGWKDNKGANYFYSMFGSNFKEHMKEKAKELEFKSCQDAFIELVSTRNKFSHEGSSAHANYTAKDALDKFCSAKLFIEMFFKELERYSNNDSLQQ